MRDRADAVEHEQPSRARSLWSRSRSKAAASRGNLRTLTRALESLLSPTAALVAARTCSPLRPSPSCWRSGARNSTFIRTEVNDPDENSKPARDSVAGASRSRRLVRKSQSRRTPPRDPRLLRLRPPAARVRTPLAGMPDSAMTQLFRDPPNQPQERWLPAIEVFGEGIYFELREDRIRQWQQGNHAWLRDAAERSVRRALAGRVPDLASAWRGRPHLGVALSSRPQPRARADQSVRLRMRIQHCVPARAPLRVRRRERADGRNSDLHRGRRFGGNARRARASWAAGETWCSRATRAQSRVVVFCRSRMFGKSRRPRISASRTLRRVTPASSCRRLRARRSTRVSIAP